MLGVGSGSSKSGKIRRLVKNGLQAWYKADKTQAPLGEEEIADGDFSLGPDIVGGDLATFFGGPSAATMFSHASGLVTVIGGDGVRYVGKGDLLEHEKTYKVTVDVVTLPGGNPKVYLGGSQSDTLVQGINVKYITTQDGADSHDEWFGFNESDGLVFRSYTVERTNPNDSWTTNAQVTIKDGEATLVETNPGGIMYQNVLVSGKRYQYSLQAKSSDGLSGLKLKNNSSTIGSAYSNIPQTFTTYSGTFTAAAVDFTIAEVGLESITVKDISVREVTNSVKDFSPNINNGVLYSGKALSFDGDGDYVDLGTVSNDTTVFTAAFWAKVDDVSSERAVLQYGKTLIQFGTSGQILCWPSTSGSSGGNHSTSFSTASVDRTAWNRYAIVIDGYNVSLYINNDHIDTKQTSGPDLITDGADDFQIGSYNTSRNFDGTIADLQIYDKAWTPSDVKYDWENPDKDVFDDEGRVEVLGPELSLNGDFEISGVEDDWNLNSNWDISNGVASTNGTANSDANQLFTAEIGKYYCVSIDIKTITQGGYRLSVGEGLTDYFYVTGVHKQIVLATSTDRIRIQGTDNPIGGLEMISVKEITTHKAEISPTDCKALYRLNEGAGDRVYNAAPVLREDLFSGYDLDNWIELSNSDIINSTTFNTTGGSSTGIFLASTTTEGRIYKLTIAGTTDSNGFQFANPGEGSHIYWDSGSSTGNFSDTIIFEAKHTQVYLKNKTAGTTTITTLKLQEISLSESYAQASFAPSNWKTAQPYIPQYAMSSYSKKMIFDGSDDYVLLSTTPAAGITIPAADPFSFSFWYQNAVETGDQPILGKAASTSDYLILNNGDGGIAFKADNETEVVLNFDTELTAGKLNHIVLTSAGGAVTNGLKVYVDGVLNVSQNTINADFDFRTFFKSNTDHGEGFMDELAYFSKELSATEVQEIFNTGMALDCRDHSAYLGSELTTNGGMDDETWWSMTSGDTSIGNGTVNLNDVGNGQGFQRANLLDVGSVYTVTFELTSFTSGYIGIYDGTSYHGNTSAIGEHSVTFTANSTTFFMLATSGSTLSVDNVSVKKVDLNGYWRNNGTDTWTDLSEYGNDGTVNGSPTTIQLQEVPYFKKDTFGLPMNKVRQKGLNFDGDSYVKVEDDASLSTMSGGFTCSFWFLHSENIGSGNWHYLVTKGKGLGADPDNGFSTAFYNGVLYFDLNTKTTLTGAGYGADPTITYNANSDVASDMLITGTGVLEPEGFLRVGAVDSSNTSLEAEDKDGNSQNVSGSSHTGETITLNQRSTVVKTLGAPSNPTWHYITATYTNNGNLRLYVDSTLQDTSDNVVVGDVSTTAEAHPIVIGSSKDYNYKSPQVIDDVKWYNRPLELSEIKKNYKATKSRHSSTSTWSDDFSSDFI
jgi:hypothetical protein